jgi:hypothetical protein
VDVTAPSAPRALGIVDTPGEATDVAVSGAYAYVADGSGGLQVIHVGDPTNPFLAVAYDTSGRAVGVAVAGTRAYVAVWDSGIIIVDISSLVQ